MDPVCLLGIPDPPELRETPRPNSKAARSRDTCLDETHYTLISDSTSLEGRAFTSKNMETGLHIKEGHVTVMGIPAGKAQGGPTIHIVCGS